MSLAEPSNPPTPAEQVPTLLQLYKENADQARHHELQRSTVSTIVGAAAGVILALAIPKEGRSVPGNYALLLHSAFLCCLGWVGLRLCQKHYERSKLHHARIRQIRTALASITGLELNKMNAAADVAHQKDFPEFYYPLEEGKSPKSKQRLNRIWETFHRLIMLAGATLLLIVVWPLIRWLFRI